MKRFLIIDDINEEPERLEKLLRENGYSVEEATGTVHLRKDSPQNLLIHPRIFYRARPLAYSVPPLTASSSASILQRYAS